jgi:hypothetical protein
MPTQVSAEATTCTLLSGRGTVPITDVGVRLPDEDVN